MQPYFRSEIRNDLKPLPEGPDIENKPAAAIDTAAANRTIKPPTVCFPAALCHIGARNGSLATRI